jgi:hypothetical protein
MNRFFIAIATAGILLAAPAFAQSAGNATSADSVAQVQTTEVGHISQDFAAHSYRRHYHTHHYSWHHGHHWGWRHRPYRHHY